MNTEITRHYGMYLEVIEHSDGKHTPDTYLVNLDVVYYFRMIKLPVEIYGDMVAVILFTDERNYVSFKLHREQFDVIEEWMIEIWSRHA